MQQNINLRIVTLSFFPFDKEIELVFPTRTRADQHKCLPHLACINPKPLLF